MGFLSDIGDSIGGIAKGAVGGFLAGGPVGAVAGGVLGGLSGREGVKGERDARRANRRANAVYTANLGKATELQKAALGRAGSLERSALKSGTRRQRIGVKSGAGSLRSALSANEAAVLESLGHQDLISAGEYDLTSGAYQPQLDVARGAMDRLNILSGGGTPEEQAAAYRSFTESPGYQFRLTQGDRAIRRLAGDRYGSGAMYKDLLKYNQGLATDEFGRHVGQLQHLASFAPAAASGMATAGSNYGRQLRQISGARGGIRGQTALRQGQVDAESARELAQLSANRTLGLATSEADEIRAIADLEERELIGASDVAMRAAELKAQQAAQRSSRRQGQLSSMMGLIGTPQFGRGVDAVKGAYGRLTQGTPPPSDDYALDYSYDFSGAF